MAGILGQAQGTRVQAATDTASFMTQATTALKMGYDPIMNAVSQVLGRTIFSNRPYTAKFTGLRRSEQQWGNHVRKINYIDKPMQDNDEWKLTEGESIDQYVINKPEVVQTNFYGGVTYMKQVTTFRDQIHNAFQGPDQLGEFISGYMQNASDQIEQVRENMSRAALANFIGAKAQADKPNVIHLATEFGASVEDNYEAFVKYAYGRIATVAGMMSERSNKYHMNLANKNIMRHTPEDRLKMYVLASDMNNIQTSVLSSVFNPDKLRMIDHETVNFWQSIDAPADIFVKPSWTASNGNIQSANEAVKTSNVFAVLFDEEAIGQTTFNQSVDVSPYNARGKYYNTFFHFTERYWNDFTENGVVFLLD